MSDDDAEILEEFAVDGPYLVAVPIVSTGRQEPTVICMFCHTASEKDDLADPDAHADDCLWRRAVEARGD